jgi:hypothetical protein
MGNGPATALHTICRSSFRTRVRTLVLRVPRPWTQRVLRALRRHGPSVLPRHGPSVLRPAAAAAAAAAAAENSVDGCAADRRLVDTHRELVRVRPAQPTPAAPAPRTDVRVRRVRTPIALSRRRFCAAAVRCVRGLSGPATADAALRPAAGAAGPPPRAGIWRRRRRR